MKCLNCNREIKSFDVNFGIKFYICRFCCTMHEVYTTTSTDCLTIDDKSYYDLFRLCQKSPSGFIKCLYNGFPVLVAIDHNGKDIIMKYEGSKGVWVEGQATIGISDLKDMKYIKMVDKKDVCQIT